ncbi:MAG TPA: GDYXXLXY domain-containing protein [Croceibacterium sp.]
MSPALRALSLALPLLGLAATWGYTHVRAQQGTEWDVPIAGYDPRDLLRGHYVVFTYDWPVSERVSELVYARELCIQGTAPTIDRVTFGDGRACGNPVRAYDYSDDFGGGITTGRLYVSQAEGARLQEQLTDPALQGTVHIRLRADGHITPLRISFRPRPAVPTTPPAADEP